MANDAAAIVPSASQAEGSGPVGSDKLAQGLLLVRASAIKVVRLQLAMERRDRRVALETVDELVQLDRRISDFLDELPAGPDGGVRRELEEQGRALAREKFALAAGMNGPRLSAGPDPWIDPSEASEPPAPQLAELDLLGAGFEAPELEAPAGERGLSAAATVAMLMLAALILGAAAFLLLTQAGQELIAPLPYLEGASQ